MPTPENQNWDLKFTLKNASLSQFVDKKKKKLAEGALQVYSDPMSVSKQKQGPIFKIEEIIVEVNNKKGFVRWAHQSKLYYFFEGVNQNLHYLSVQKKYEELKNFQEILLESSNIVQYDSKNTENALTQKVKTLYFQQKGFLQKLGKGFGMIAGTASKVISKPVSQKVSAISERMSRSSVDTSNDQTKSKWQILKQKSNKLNQTVTNFVKPAVEKYREFEDYVGSTFSQSNNKVIKTIRESGKAFAESANEAEKAIIEGSEDQKQKEQQSNIELSQK